MYAYSAVTLVLAAIALVVFLRALSRRRVSGYLARTVVGYGIGFVSCWVALNLVFFQMKTSAVVPSFSGELRAKVASYRRHAGAFDLLFVGDSRTFCAMQPDILDRHLGTRSVNLARWAHWFPTQHAQYRDLVRWIPERTTVVWSIGHQNFSRINDRIGTAYPIGLIRVPKYLALGHDLDRLIENLLYFNPVTNVIGRLPQLREQLDSKLNAVVWNSEIPERIEGPEAQEARAILRRYRGHPLVAGWQVLQEDGRITSLAITKANGAYYRIELDNDFFRHKQREDAARKALEAPLATAHEPEPAYWNQFLAILDLFQRHGVRLIVNELEEAPHQYVTPEIMERTRRFMRERVRPEVERRGFAYLRADLDRLTDEDYFDYNHLNSRGIDRYSAMLAELLRPELSAAGG